MAYYVTLTSFPERIKTVNITIESLINQTYKVDGILLWLAQSQFPKGKENLPQELLELEKRGLIIKWCDDLKSYKKLIPALKEYPNDFLITADDDLIYEKDWVERLISAYEKAEGDVLCVHRAHQITFHDNKLDNYKHWNKCVSKVEDSFNNLLTTGGGCLFYPNCFYSDVLREDLFGELSPTSDDIWFWAMLVMNGVKVRVIENNISEITFIDGTQAISLLQQNVDKGLNDKNLHNILEKYPQILNKLKPVIREEIPFSHNIKKVLEENKNKRIMFWGASLFLEKFLSKNDISNYNILGVVDKNPQKWESKINNYNIYPPEMIKKLNPDIIVFSILNNYEKIFSVVQKYVKEEFPNVQLIGKEVKDKGSL